MSYYPTPSHAMNHPRHSTGENTPADSIAAFKSANPMHECKPYGCTMRGEVCKKRRALAFSTPRKAMNHMMRTTWKTDAIMQVDKCLKCESYWKPTPNPVPAKHGVCSCGCGREGRLVGRGMLSGCYQKYRKGRRVHA